jgi:hypothetical protein
MPDRQDDLNPASDLAPFADALKALAPQPAHLSRDALLFEAGKAAASPRTAPWVWPGATAAFAALSLVLGAFLISPGRSGVVYVDRTVYVQAPPAAVPAPAPTPELKSIGPTVVAKKENTSEDDETARLLRQRRDVLRWGVDMLPESKPKAGGPSRDETTRDTISWLNLPPGTFTALPSTMPKKPAKSSEESDE